jgi:RND family efflux transporter MFP subunit
LHKNRTYSGTIALLSIFAFAAVSSFTGCSNKKEAKGKPVAVKPREITPVHVVTVQPANLQRDMSIVGTIRHRRETPLGFTTSGKVSAVRFDVGDYVKRGALIAALDGTNVGADLQLAQAERERADADFARIASLYKDGWVTKARFESAEAASKAASARFNQAGYARGTAQVFAPSSGVVLSRQVQAGQVVSAGSPILVLGQDNEGFVFRGPVVASDASNLKAGMAVKLTIEALGGNPIDAVISEIDGRADPLTGAFTVQIRIPSGRGIRSGQIGTAAIVLPAANDGTLQIPASALFGVRTGEGLVYIVNGEGKVETRNVIIGKVTDGFVMVKGAIKAGETLVVSGTEKLQNGVRVRAIPFGQ